MTAECLQIFYGCERPNEWYLAPVANALPEAENGAGVDRQIPFCVFFCIFLFPFW